MQHPDYEQEQEQLEFTKQYLEIVIRASLATEETFREEMKQALEGMDFKDSSFRYMTMLTNSNLLRQTNEQLRQLKKIEKKPYFARIDFLEGDKEVEELYIGKASLMDRQTQKQIIVDWRSPISNLYYDGRLGDVSYVAAGGEYFGNLSMKRQYMIDDGQLLDIRDVDLTTTDELLQQSLSGSSSNRLNDIVATIQEEQNKIIRADLNKPIIVQGAAGSGKTTIALHRIAYFIYTYADQFDPRELMILAPNRLFIDYISEVLPELGVDNILQMTFVDYVKSVLKKNIKLKHPDEKLIRFLNREVENPEQLQWISSFKGSLDFCALIDRYLNDILITQLPKEDFYLDKFHLYHAKKLRRLMREDYAYLPFYERKDKIKRVLQNHVRTEKKRLLLKVKTFYDEKLDSALISTQIDSDKRKRYVTEVLDKRDALLAQITKEARTCSTNYINKLPKRDLFYYYQKLMTNKVLLAKYGEGIIDETQIDLLYSHEKKLYQEGFYEVEDLAALLYMQQAIFGIDKKWKAKNVVIDEAQDYSYFQLYALKSALQTDMFTIVGDLAQGVHSYRGIQDWDIVHSKIFPRATYTTLKKSYRTTVEIMNTANEILQLLHLPFPQVEPVVRHGDKPTFYSYTTGKELVQMIEKQVSELYAQSFKTIAIIGKTNQECAKIKKLFQTHSKLETQLLKENEDLYKEKVVIVSSHLSKGLEFDAVLVCLVDDVFEDVELDVKLLYVSMTRPLHRLFFYGKEKEGFLLNYISDSVYQV